MRRNSIVAVLLLIALLAAPVFAAVSAADRAQIKALAQKHAGLRVDSMLVESCRDWAFVDVAQKGADGNWESGISLLMKKKNGKWTFLTKGDVHSPQWQQYTKQMPADVRKAQEKWDAGHY